MMPQWPMMAPVQYPSFGVQGGGGHGYQRQETRQCLVCSKFDQKMLPNQFCVIHTTHFAGQIGHIARNCPNRGPIPAAMGAAPK